MMESVILGNTPKVTSPLEVKYNAVVAVVYSVASGGVHSGIFSGVWLPAFVSEHPTEAQHTRHGRHSGLDALAPVWLIVKLSY